MSVEAVWDLRTPASPRSLCVCAAAAAAAATPTNTAGAVTNPNNPNTNPFDSRGSNPDQQDQQQQQQQSAPITAIFGTDAGSVHARTFAMGASYDGVRGLLPSALSSTNDTVESSKASSSSSRQEMQLPLGMQSQQQQQSTPSSKLGGALRGVGGSSALAPSSSAAGAGAQQQQLPRSYYPVDLTTPGSSVVACILLSQTHYNRASIFLLLLDDNRGTSASQPGAFAAHLACLYQGSFQIVLTSATSQKHPPPLPRMSCATFHPQAGLVYAAGRCVASLPPEMWESVLEEQFLHHAGGSSGNPFGVGGAGKRQQQQRFAAAAAAASKSAGGRRFVFPRSTTVLPSPGARSGQDALALAAHGRVALVAVGSSFYAVAGQELRGSTVASGGAGGLADSQSPSKNSTTQQQQVPVESAKVLSFAQSSQVHPVICLDVNDQSLDPDWSCVFLANGRECAVVDLHYGPPSAPRISCSKPRNGTATLASPILAAAESWPWIMVLTSDGLVSIRSPSCMAIPLRTVEVGNQPNDFFVLRTLRDETRHQLAPSSSSYPYNQLTTQSSTAAAASSAAPWIVAVSYSGLGKVLQCQPDTEQDLADRLMRHAIDAFGANGFPRAELAEAIKASFTATSYVGVGGVNSGSSNNNNDGPSSSSSASSTNTSSSTHHQVLLLQYLEAILGLTDWESGGISGWPTEFSKSHGHHGSFGVRSQDFRKRSGVVSSSSHSSGGGRSAAAAAAAPTVVSAATPAALLCATSLLCLVCMQLSPPNPSLANRAAQACAEKMGVVIEGGVPDRIGTGGGGVGPSRGGGNSAAGSHHGGGNNEAAIRVCEMIADRLLNEPPQAFTLLPSGSSVVVGSATGTSSNIPRSSRHTNAADLIEAAVWMLRAGGKHERAISVVYDRLQRHGQLDSGNSSTGSSVLRGSWSNIKYESYTATHLSELWASGTNEGRRLVIHSSATLRLLENNPRLGLSVFTAVHPQNEVQWRALNLRDDPLAKSEGIKDVVKLLKSIHPSVPYNTQEQGAVSPNDETLPLQSGRAMAITYLESAIGIDTGRPTEEDEFDSLPMDPQFEENLATFHDELAYLLLEGVIAERRDDIKSDMDSALGSIYRNKLRRLLRWPLAKIRSEKFMNSLPNSFLQEKALVLGRLGRHEDALRILYRELNSLDLALEYCDIRHERLKRQQERARSRHHQESMFGDHDQYEASGREEDNAYLPLVRVALDSSDTERGTAAAIKVLALRRSAIDRAAALRLLPSDVLVSAVARPFLIPALVDSESQVRRLTVVSALLRARYTRLKGQLTSAQLKAQANLHVVPQLRSLNLGDPLHSTNPFKARTNSQTGNMPEVLIVKHFFTRHLVIQAKVSNSVGLLSGKFARTYTDIAFVVAESSEEAIQPLIQVPIQVLPPKMTGCAWCVLSAAPARMEGPTAQLTCELRYTVQSTETTTTTTSGTSSSGGSASAAAAVSIPMFPNPAMAGMGRAYVEELQDLEVHASHFS